MLNENSPAKWRVFGASVCGASHTQAGTDNQDAIGWWPETGEGPPLVICVSDGHGSPKSFRSDIGARLAVSVANETLVAQLGEPAGVQCLEGSSLHELARALVSRWTEAVWDDLNKRPFTDAELARLSERPNGQEILLVYGATLLAVTITDSCIVYLQLGDGDILSVSKAGRVIRPLPDDDRLLGNETTSLCMPNADREFRVGLLSSREELPSLILLTTDGYSNSYRSESDFLKVGSDIFEMIRNSGAEYVSNNLQSWLEEVSQRGSGDDVTAVIAYCVGLA